MTEDTKNPDDQPKDEQKPELDAWQKRVLKEKEDLDEKTTKLRGYLAGDKVRGIGPVSQNLLVRQADAMQAYSDILAERIAHFGPDQAG